MNGNIEELITALYDLIQDAKALPLGADKCIVERDRALDMLDEISALLPAEFKQARTIVQSREELVSQARREAETIVRNARTRADELVQQEAIYQEARQRCEDMVLQTQNRIQELKRVSNGYVDDSLRQTEEAIVKALTEVRETRSRFQSVAEPAASAAPAANQNSFNQDIG